MIDELSTVRLSLPHCVAAEVCFKEFHDAGIWLKLTSWGEAGIWFWSQPALHKFIVLMWTRLASLVYAANTPGHARALHRLCAGTSGVFEGFGSTRPCVFFGGQKPTHA